LGYKAFEDLQYEQDNLAVSCLWLTCLLCKFNTGKTRGFYLKLPCSITTIYKVAYCRD
jgi:hypothetical protein